MKHTLKVGDKVRVVSSKANPAIVGRVATVIDIIGRTATPVLQFANADSLSLHSGHDHSKKADCWFVNDEYDAVVEPADGTISLGRKDQLSSFKSIADDLRLTPQTRKILAHLEDGKSISPLEAQNVYGIYRLAGRIHDLRNAGYVIDTAYKRDEAGHRYARYSLAA